MVSRELEAALGRLIDQVERYRLAVARHLGCTAAESRILDLLRERGPLSVGQVARAVHARHSVVTGIAARLEGRGLLERRQDTTDRRRTLLAVPEEGEEALDSPYRLFAEAMVDLDDDRVAEVVDALRLTAETLGRRERALSRRHAATVDRDGGAQQS